MYMILVIQKLIGLEHILVHGIFFSIYHKKTVKSYILALAKSRKFISSSDNTCSIQNFVVLNDLMNC